MDFWNILYLIFVLSILIGLMYLLLYLMKRFLFSYAPKGVNKTGIDVVSVKTIMPKKYLAIVKVNDKNYLIGISDTNINLIDKLDDLAIEDEIITNNSNENLSFKELLKKNLGMK
jgi:flagellar biosynthetic protein FliO